MKQLAISTITRLYGRAPLGFLSQLRAPCLSCPVATRAELGAVPRHMNTITSLGVAELANPSCSTGKPLLPHRELVQTVVASAPRKILRPKRYQSKLRTLLREKHLRLPRTGRLLQQDRAQSLATSVLPPALAKTGLRQQSIGLKVTRRGWQPCTNPTLAFRLTSRCSPHSPRRCNRNSGRRKDGLRPRMTATLHL